MPTPATLPEPDEIDALSRRAHAIYADRLQQELEPVHNGEFVAIHVDSADHAISRTSSGARFALRQRHPEGMIVTTKIGPLETDSVADRILAGQETSGRQK